MEEVGSGYIDVTAISRLLADLPGETITVSLICASLGTIILSRHTLWMGWLTYVLNFLVLVAGAMGANLMLRDVSLPLGLTLDRPLLIAIGGMLVVSLITLALLPRDTMSG